MGAKMEVLISPKRAAKMLGVSTDSLRNWELAGKLKCVKTLGGHRRFKLEEVKKLLKKNST
jgi:excisionase family DNA binding protein